MGADLLLLITTCMLLSTIGLVFLYYKRIKGANEEYKRSKNILDDVIISYNTQFKKHEKELILLNDNIKDSSLKIEKVINKQRDLFQKFETFENKNEIVSGIEKRLLVLTNKVDEIIERNISKSKGLESKGSNQSVEVIRKTEIESAIPIRVERTLAHLTKTEIQVLKTLADEGEKTAPEIKERIDLSREHTSRLMRNLYVNGYLERDTRKTPYIYRLKREMATILKTESL